MPRSAGVYTLPVPPFVDGAVISATDNNTNNTDIANALTGSVPRDGTGAMQAALPMGGYKISNLANAVASTDAVAYGQLAERLIEKTIITGTPTFVDFALPSGFTSFRLVGTTLYSASGSFIIGLRTSVDGGATYAAGASDYASAFSFQGSTLNAGSTNGASVFISDSCAANTPIDFNAQIVRGDGAFGLRTWGTSTGVTQAATARYVGTFGGTRSATGAATNIRIIASSAFANTGVLTLFGVV
jgi:hypothetical protein